MERLPPLSQELLDRGVDPLDDPRVCEWLLQHPEALEPFAALRARLDALPSVAALPAPTAPRRRWPWLLAAGLGACALGTAVALATGSDRAASLPRPDFSPTGRIVSFTAITRVEGDGSAYVATVTAGNAARLHRTRFAATAAPSPGVPLCAASLTTEENLQQ